MNRKIGEIWKTDRGFTLRLPYGIYTFKTRRIAMLIKMAWEADEKAKAEECRKQQK